MGLTYEQAVQRLLWLGHEGRALKWDLNNIRALLARLGHPERQFACVHIAGTNGKGSVAAMVDSILRAAGCRTGLYTSPHLLRLNERIAIDGGPISDEGFATAFNTVAEAIEALLADNRLPHHPSYFECLTAMALQHFAQTGVELAVLEVGLGGRLDATNVVTPEVAVITPIDFDHERYLGHAIEQIAAEKAGIIKPGVPVVSAAEHPRAREIVTARAGAVGAPLVDVERQYRAEAVCASDLGRYEFIAQAADGFRVPLAPSLRGAFQVRNALVALAAARQLTACGRSVNTEDITTGVSQSRWPGRMELVQRHPLLFFDGAHNPAGARQVLRFWEEHLPGRRIHLVYGTLRDKVVEEVAELLFPRAASIILTRPSTSRAVSPEWLARLASALNRKVGVDSHPASALTRALEEAGRDDVVFVTGSLFLVGDCQRALGARARVAARRPAPVAVSGSFPAEQPA